jgi:hypothetical protein
MEDNKLIKFEINQLQKIGNAIAITNKLLGSSNRKIVADLFCQNPKFFFKTISWYYGLNHHLIHKYKEKWNFPLMSRNEEIVWSLEFIEKYENKWEWQFGLCYNKSIPWSPEIIEKYFDKWDWDSLARNKSLVEKGWFKNNYGYKIEPETTNRKFQEIKMTSDEIDKYVEKFSWDRSVLSSGDRLPWSVELLEKYIDTWDWNTLSDNQWLPWSEEFIDKFKERWNWTNLSSNSSLFWTEKIIEKYKTRWYWSYLFLNNSIHWSISLMIKYKSFLKLTEKCNDNLWNNYFKDNVDDFLVEFVLDMNV